MNASRGVEAPSAQREDAVGDSGLPPASADSMRDYYAQRAHSYERIYAKPERQADLRTLESRLPDFFAGRHVLEVACGTGYWTRFGASRCASWCATDLSPETLALARAKPWPAGTVRFEQADAYSLAELGARRFDAAFSGFWWSHVPLARLGEWLAVLHARLPSGASVMHLDNRYVDGSSTPVSRRDGAGNTYQTRTLDDGSMHEVLKNFPRRDGSIAALGPRARDAQWLELTHYWLLSYSLA
jgi:demethylmenaquinone methyltransferase/2-methoxy-6-polyprenyl-1,4-benzoquinol methylase